MPAKRRSRSNTSWLWWIGLGFGLPSLLVLGWYWNTLIPLQSVTIEAGTHASVEEVRTYASIDSTKALYQIAPGVIADRVENHPWIEQADVDRIPTGVLSIEFTERSPVALVLDGQGAPTYYVDGSGAKMPYQLSSKMYDVPVIRGLTESFDAGRTVSDSSLSGFLRTAQPMEDAWGLISEIELSETGGIQLYTVGHPGQGSLPVTLGVGGYQRKLAKLVAFWDQVIEQRGEWFRRVDLRFDDQVVTEQLASVGNGR